MTFALAYPVRTPPKQSRSNRMEPRQNDARQLAPKTAQPMTFGASVMGIKLFDDIAKAPDGGALVMENYVAGSSAVRPRRGAAQHATGIGGEVRALASYEGPLGDKLFAIGGAGTHGIFDATAGGAVGAALVSGLVANTIWSFTRFTTSGAVFLVACGAGNARLLYNGSTWGTTPAITGVSMTSLSQAWGHGSRLWFVEQGTPNAWYLPPDAIGGAAIKFPLVGIFPRGGNLIAGATWTADTGTAGQRASCVFMSDLGDIAVYEGVDPTSWSLSNTYSIGKPCGQNCFLKSGADLAVMTEDGLVALSQIINIDADALQNESVSKDIRPLWLDAASKTDRSRWQIVRRDGQGYAVVHVPGAVDRPAEQFVANMQTGAWTTWRGWAPTCFATFAGRLFYGMADGRVIEGERGGSDLGTPYTATLIPAYKSAGINQIVAKLARSVTRSAETFAPRLTAMFDYAMTPPSPPNAGVSTGGSVWDSAVWDISLWGGTETRQPWQAVVGKGSAVSICAQYTFAQTEPPTIEIIRTDLVYEGAEVVA